MKKLLIISAIFAIIGIQPAAAQFIQNSSRSLFSDVKAFQAGDAIMVLIVEDTQADNEATIDSERGTDLSFGLDAQAGNTGTNVEAGISSGNRFSGRGRTSRNESIRSRLSARVVEVVDNGNLSIEGTRTTQINGETQTIVIRGIVRPVDVLPNNSVYSYNILDLTLLIEGEGSVTETQEPGLITKFFRLLF
ncbi:MAG: flagellar basal body L-ring protein FlgH [Candidatus Kapaibacterium sp.]